MFDSRSYRDYLFSLISLVPPRKYWDNTLKLTSAASFRIHLRYTTYAVAKSSLNTSRMNGHSQSIQPRSDQGKWNQTEPVNMRQIQQVWDFDPLKLKVCACVLRCCFQNYTMHVNHFWVEYTRVVGGCFGALQMLEEAWLSDYPVLFVV